jgi:type II secretory pathway predicted ATPase ExeA
LKVELKTFARSFLIKTIKAFVLDCWAKKQKPILIIDEASLLRVDVFTELHTIMQFENDSEPKLTIILAGQNNLIDVMQYAPSKAFASRIVARSKLEPLKQSETEAYLLHHLNIAGVTQRLFSDATITAIHKSAGGMLRKINNIARGSLIAAASQKSQVIEPIHVQIASSEVF